MNVRTARWLSPALLGLFLLSGAAGLVYQSIWSHYLGLSLGHAAYAQTLVLAIFMGGMALGAWWVSRSGLGLRRLVLAYAVVELAIGLLGLAFHTIFVATTALSQETVLPALDSVAAARVWQWGLAAALITPQTVLLGASFPLLSAGLLRARAGGDGEVLGGLYFSNSFGAVIGVLASTYLLLPALGMPGTVVLAGVLNVVVGLGAWWVSVAMGEGGVAGGVAPAATPRAPEPESARRLGRILLTTTFLSSAASFTYEIGWVRLLNQALGTTIHSFELMLAAFILGLAMGGLWVRKRSKAIADVVAYAGYVQVWMGAAALLSIPIFTQSFTWVGWLMSVLERTDQGYNLFSLGSAAIAVLVMFPAAFFAGMTLPLFTSALLREGAGERAIGRVYAANTLGAIVGVMMAVHVLIPLLGLRLAVTVAALVDVAIGLVLLRGLSPGQWSRPALGAVTVGGVALAVSLVLGVPDPVAQASGVFRTGVVRAEGAEVLFLRDGKTATISVTQAGGALNIATNGKPDASLGPIEQAVLPDEITMLMAAALPLAAHENPQRVAIIGWGSGLTTHTLLGSDRPQVVDNIEIEQAMVDGARLFGPRVERAYTDARSLIHIDDARTFFSTGQRRYDVIVSEPSNPWVSGVASLFTREFYGFLRRHLNDEGVLVQWLQSYELSDPLLATMLAALIEEFPEAEVYLTNSADLLILARKSGGSGVLNSNPWESPELAAELRRVGLGGVDDLTLRRIGGARVLRTMQRLFAAEVHSDFYPTVSLQAPRARFIGRSATLLPELVLNGLPVLDVLDCRRPLPAGSPVLDADASTFSDAYFEARSVAAVLAGGEGAPGWRERWPAPAQALAGLGETDEARLSAHVAALARSTLGNLPAADLEAAWQSPAWAGEPSQWSPAFSAAMRAYAATARRDVAGMREHARSVLEVSDSGLDASLMEQMVVIHGLGAIGTEAPAEVRAGEQLLGLRGQASNQMLAVRSFLLAWAATEGAGCAAR
jgi:predicted membrane-bound spermidine synthase